MTSAPDQESALLIAGIGSDEVFRPERRWFG
jgi:hypothetical protein